jgi:hypothetical protein
MLAELISKGHDLEERDQVHFSVWGLERALIEP